MRADRAYWARLRKDARSNWSAGLAVAAALAATVAAMGLAFTGAPMTDRLNPLYWLGLAPLAWWGASLASFEGWAVRLMVPVAVAAPLVCVAVLLAAPGGARLLPAAALALSLASAAGTLVLYRGSLLRAEGPSR